MQEKQNISNAFWLDRLLLILPIRTEWEMVAQLSRVEIRLALGKLQNG